MSSAGGPAPFTTLAVSRPTEAVTHVELHRPEKRNAMNKAFWRCQLRGPELFRGFRVLVSEESSGSLAGRWWSALMRLQRIRSAGWWWSLDLESSSLQVGLADFDSSDPSQTSHFLLCERQVWT